MADLEGLGLKCGLEIHQQLGSAGSTKLFSRAHVELDEGDPDLVITRRLRASAGEAGGVDVAATAEEAKSKLYEYHAYEGSCGLVEMDEEPPRSVNSESLETVVMVAKALKSTVMPRLQFMRKTIIDGSAVSGFQRTGLVAVGGSIPGLEKEVRIQTICLEEDSAKIVEKTSTKDVYNLSRLGIPLIEIATAPDIRTGEQAREVAAQLGMILRSTGRVKRGLGTVRQDLNVSVKGGTRCEIKGAQDLKTIPITIENEAIRQAELVKIASEIDAVEHGPVTDVTDIAKRSSKGFVSGAPAAVGMRIKGLKGYLGRELCTGYGVGTELAGMAKTWGFGGIMHSDEEMSKYGMDEEELRKALGCTDEDVFIVIAGEKSRITDLLEILIIPRLKFLSEGVPAEVRRALPDGTTTYLRPVPGAARMYPETDIPTVEAPSEVPAVELITTQISRLQKESGMSKDICTRLVKEGIPIRDYRERYPELSWQYLSSALLEWPDDIESRLKTDLGDSLEYVEPLLDLVHDGTIPGQSVKAILEKVGEKNREERFPPNHVLELAKDFGGISSGELESIVDDIVKEKPGLTAKQLMGPVMAKVKGRADGKEVMRVLMERMGDDS